MIKISSKYYFLTPQLLRQLNNYQITMSDNLQVLKQLVESEPETASCPSCGQLTSIYYFLAAKTKLGETAPSICQNCGCYDDPE
jgi:transcription elongation factor Elf1